MVGSDPVLGIADVIAKVTPIRPQRPSWKTAPSPPLAKRVVVAPTVDVVRMRGNERTLEEEVDELISDEEVEVVKLAEEVDELISDDEVVLPKIAEEVDELMSDVEVELVRKVEKVVKVEKLEKVEKVEKVEKLKKVKKEKKERRENKEHKENKENKVKKVKKVQVGDEIKKSKVDKKVKVIAQAIISVPLRV